MINVFHYRAFCDAQPLFTKSLEPYVINDPSANGRCEWYHPDQSHHTLKNWTVINMIKYKYQNLTFKTITKFCKRLYFGVTVVDQTIYDNNIHNWCYTSNMLNLFTSIQLCINIAAVTININVISGCMQMCQFVTKYSNTFLMMTADLKNRASFRVLRLNSFRPSDAYMRQ